jgi:hypothetical protein
MKLFKAIRLSTWSVIIGTTIAFSGTYLALSQTLLTAEGLNTILTQSKLSETVRDDVLLPKILQTTRGSDYAALLDDQTVTAAFNEALPAETLDSKLAPAVNSLEKWLNSKEPTITFSINMSDLSDTFARSLSQKVGEKYASIPRCTIRSSLSDAENGICRSSIISEENIRQKITELIKNDASLRTSTVITPDSVPVAPALLEYGRDIPSYLNIYYAAALVAAAIAVLSALWLIFKHRLYGIVTLGSGILLASVLLLLISIVGVERATAISTDPQILQLARAGSTALKDALQHQALLLGSSGLLLIIIGVAAILITRRRSRSSQSMRFSSDK